MKIKLILTSLIFSTLAFSQTYYTATKTTALTSSAEVITIQQPATGSRNVKFISVYFDCSVACTAALERGGVAATATALTVNPINAGDVAAVTKAFSGSDATAVTVISKINCIAACAQTLDLTGLAFKAGQTTSTNLTLRTSSITGTVDITFKFQEVQ